MKTYRADIKTSTVNIKKHIASTFFITLIMLFVLSTTACGEVENDESENYDNFSGSENSANLDYGVDTVQEKKAVNAKYTNAVSKDIKPAVFAPLAADGKTVEYVDLERYLGRWYEIATIEQPFQRNCTGTTATYGLNDNGTVSVLNECYKNSLTGRYDVIEGYARIADKATNARLRVYFFPLFGAPYHIVELDDALDEDPYQWAVVSSPIKSFLWILSRTPQLSQRAIDQIIERLEKRGYPVDRLTFTVQPSE